MKGIPRMRIRNVSITVRDLAMAVQFYRDTLLLPVESTPEGAHVVIGSSRLSMTAGDGFVGVHHLAFGILPSEFGRAHKWLARRVSLFQADGSEIIPGSDHWKSRSLYFLGPEGIILEFIARDADASADSSRGDKPRILSISEVGIGVEDVLGTVATLSEELAIPNFYDCSSTFASMGGHDGLLIVVHRERVWFPTESSRPAHGSLTVQIESPARNTRVEPGPGISIVSG
jgi:catechol-2,3-dioxygenase